MLRALSMQRGSSAFTSMYSHSVDDEETHADPISPAVSVVLDTIPEVTYSLLQKKDISKGLSTNILLLMPFIFIVSLLFGTIFYKVHHGWELSTAFYFSAQVLAGVTVNTSSFDIV